MRGAPQPDTSVALRVAYSNLTCDVRPALDNLCRAATSFLAGSQGGFVETSKPFDPQRAEWCFYALGARSFAKKFAGQKSTPNSKFKPEIQWNIDATMDAAPKEMVFADSNLLYHQVKPFFDAGVGILMAPATLNAPFGAKIRYPVTGFGVPDKDPFSDS